MIIYFMRHGETDWNTKQLFQGRTDICLNENGRKVAEWTKEGLQDVKFDAAFCSPLLRAKETAEIILQGRDVELHVDDRLIEMAFGIYEGCHMQEQDENLKNFFKQPELYQTPEGGESIDEVFERGENFLNELYANPKYQDSTILVATHGAFLHALMGVIKNQGLNGFMKGGLYKNCGMTMVEVVDGIPKILREAFIVYDEDRTE